MNSKPPVTRGVAAFGLAWLLALSGCGYGEVSPVAYEYAKALYALSNRRAADRIDAVEAQIEGAVESGQLPSHEAGWLAGICADCRAGRWDEAQASARRMMTDQVGRRAPRRAGEAD